MSSKHTPGPWEVSHGGHGSPHGFVIDEYYVLNRTVADDVAIAADIVDPATQMPSEANARLIAAAPEMFEALDTIGGLSRALRQGGPDPMDLQGLSDALEEAVDLANSLVAQIEGRT
ncbi:TPA: hypothetical protein ACKQC2_000721 [Stenotrophomonas maltophilia]